MSLKQEKILIFQIASLGDTTVSVPVYREIARRHPDADRYLLTSFPTGVKCTTAEAILRPMGLINGTIEYPMPLRSVAVALQLQQKIRTLRPTKLYYLAAMVAEKLPNLVRHFAFFKFCGIQEIEGIPWSHELRYPKEILKGVLWESEASRLLRSIHARTEPGPPPEADRLLDLTLEETTKAWEWLSQNNQFSQFAAISTGGKVPINDWGDANWARLAGELSVRCPGLGAVFVGSADERTRNEKLAAHWKGPTLNACGLFTPRETAALLARAQVFIGHDTGTLHLAAAVNTPVVGIFAARNVPGKWFSDRARDKFLFRTVECMGCGLDKVADCPYGRKCITSITPEEVLAAAKALLGEQLCPFVASFPPIRGA